MIVAAEHFGSLLRNDHPAFQNETWAHMSSSSVGMDAETLRGLFIEMSRAHRVVEKDEVPLVEKLCEVAKAFLISRAKSLVTQTEGRALMWTYGSDATPMPRASISRGQTRESNHSSKIRFCVRVPG